MNEDLVARVQTDPIGVVREIERRDRHYRIRTAALLVVVAILTGITIASLVVAVGSNAIVEDSRDRSTRGDCIREYTNDSLQLLDEFVSGLLEPEDIPPATEAAFKRRLDRNRRNLEAVDDGRLCPPIDP